MCAAVLTSAHRAAYRRQQRAAAAISTSDADSRREAEEVVEAEAALARDILGHVNALLGGLQGFWEDNFGRTVEVSGDVVHFNDGTGAWRIHSEREVVWLRGARVVGGSKQQPVWQWHDGVKWIWTRRSLARPEDAAFSAIFQQYKSDRERLRRRVWAAALVEDFQEAARARAEWAEGGLPAHASLMQEARLAAGKFLAPGVCIRHRPTGHRGVVVSCHPRPTGPAAKEARSSGQPFYHCLMDERDRSGFEYVAFVPEDELEASSDSFPVLNRLTRRLLVRCDELEGYLPSPVLEEVLNEQHRGESTVIAW